MLEHAAVPLMGLSFGFALQKANIAAPGTIISQMLFSRFIMLKVFLTAVATSCLVVLVLHSCLHNPSSLINARFRYPRQGLLSTAAGAVILGVGMTVSGACPGTVAVQIGMGIPHSLWTVAGGLLGALTYAFVFPSLQAFLEMSTPADTKMEVLTGWSFKTLSALMFVAMIAALTLLEYLVPWTSEVPIIALQNSGNIGLLEKAVWMPYWSGLVVGTLQIPAILLLNAGIGSATSYVATWVQCFNCLGIHPAQSYLKHFQGGFATWWQIPYLLCAALGSYFASALSNQDAVAAMTAPGGVSAAHAFVGGFLLLIGSRMASGCTSGHGLSGMPFLIVNSFVAVPAMFGGNQHCLPPQISTPSSSASII